MIADFADAQQENRKVTLRLTTLLGYIRVLYITPGSLDVILLRRNDYAKEILILIKENP